MEKKDFKKLSNILSVVLIILTSVSCVEKQHNILKKVSAEATKIAPLFKSDRFLDNNGNSMPYRYFEPVKQGNPVTKTPLILYLHGEAEFGIDNGAQLTTTECATIWVEPDHQAVNPAYILAPQAPAGSNWLTDPVYSNTLALLNQFIDNHPDIDTQRIYIVGFSAGATGVWNMILKNPKLFAAAMPISGNADKWLGDYDAWAALKNFPVYVIHSYDDQESPVSGSMNAVAALQAGGNKYVFSGSPNPSLWSPGSTASPHDAWYTAFHKFEVVYNSLFWHSLEKTNNGEISPTMLYTKKDLGNGVTSVWDYALSTAYVIEGSDKAIIYDATMGQGNIYQYIKDNVLVNKDIDIDIFISHNHNDHIYGLSSFIGSSQVKSVFVHQDDKDAVIKLLGPDAGKVRFAEDGDKIPFNGSNIEILVVPGHSMGSIVMMYDSLLVSGDAIGTGYIGASVLSVEEYIQSIQHLLDKMGNKKYTILGGHTGECRLPLTENYVFNLLKCAKGIAEGSIEGVPYWRNARYVATYGDASITYDLNNKNLIKGALRGLSVSEGVLSPAFAAFTVYYSVSVAPNVNTIDITPFVRAKDYKGMTINGFVVVSGKAYKADLIKGENRFSIEVTSSDNTVKVYTLTIQKGT